MSSRSLQRSDIAADGFFDAPLQPLGQFMAGAERAQRRPRAAAQSLVQMFAPVSLEAVQVIFQFGVEGRHAGKPFRRLQIELPDEIFVTREFFLAPVTLRPPGKTEKRERLLVVWPERQRLRCYRLCAGRLARLEQGGGEAAENFMVAGR